MTYSVESIGIGVGVGVGVGTTLIGTTWIGILIGTG